MSALAPLAPKLGPLLRLLASDCPGEVVAAARAIGRVLAGAGLDFHALANGLADVSPAERPGGDVVAPSRADWSATAAWCLTFPDLLSAREKDFLRAIAAGRWRGPSPSQAQCDWLADILDRLAAEARAA